MKRTLKSLFVDGQPKWFRLLNGAILLPILIWPLIFYTTIFFFDNPKNLGLTFLVFLAVNAYPLYLLVLTYYNSRLFEKNRVFGLMLPSLASVGLVGGVLYILIGITTNISESIRRENERITQGYIGVNDDFKVLENKVYYRDTVINGADAKSFEIISWDWQRDKNFYYRFGKKIQYIDRKSFELLDYHYAKDKFHVYYDENIIPGADSKTFYHLEGTQDGRDSRNCYRWGEKVDCKELLTEE